MRISQYVVDLVSVGASLFLDLLEQSMEDLPFSGLVGDEIPKMARSVLTDPVDPAEALLYSVRVPWQVVVHHHVGDLEIDTFPSCVGSDEDLDRVVGPETDPGSLVGRAA